MLKASESNHGSSSFSSVVITQLWEVGIEDVTFRKGELTC